MDAVLERGGAEHWVAHLSVGSFTAPGADERLALVGNIGDEDEIRWVVVGREEGKDDWRVMGISEWLGSGFDAPPPFYLSPDLLDFDNDGRQELLSHYSRTQWGWTNAVDALYRWDGYTLARVWRADTVRDNTMAEDQDAPQPYREDYRAEWEWVDLDGDALNEILLRGRTTFYPTDQPGGEGDPLGEEAWERAFRWDGEALRPYAPNGPFGTFAYTALGSLWLWQDHAARPLRVGHVREFHWSPDGKRLAWWARPSSEEDSSAVILGSYDLMTETRREFSLDLEDELLGLRWTPGNRLVYILPDGSSVLLDPETGQVDTVPAVPLGTWSPDGEMVAYVRDGSLYVYDLAVGQERHLVVPPEGPGAPSILPGPVWSPRGDWIAYYLANESLIWVGLVTTDLSEPVSGFGILETFDGLEAPGLGFTWSPDGSRLAVLAGDPESAQQPTVLYAAELPAGEGRGVGLPDWRTISRLEAVDHRSVRVGWSPGGERMVLAAGQEILDVDDSGETTLRRRFSVPELEWTALEWAPDGSGFLVGVGRVYDEHLYWFPADGTEPVLLIAGSLGTVGWSPEAADVRADAGTVLVEYTDGVPLLHFVGEDGSDIVVPAKGAERNTLFQVGGDRVYYNKAYADRNGGVSLFVSDALAGCRPPSVSPDGRRLAWLCDDGIPDWSDIISGTAEIHFRLIVTDDRGKSPREAWNYVEAGPDYRDVRMIGWRGDGDAVYLSRPKYGTAWAYFDYNPGILVLDLSTGETTQVGDLESVHDGLVSPDGMWIAQSKTGEWPNEEVFVVLRSLMDGTERTVTCAEGSTVAGDFSFSPGNAWLAWREWATAPGGSMFLIRVLRLPDGEPLTVYGDAELTAPQIGGWIGEDGLVLVHPSQEDGTGGYSTVVTLPTVGMGDFLSPFAFLGTLDKLP